MTYRLGVNMELDKRRAGSVALVFCIRELSKMGVHVAVSNMAVHVVTFVGMITANAANRGAR